MKQLIFRSRLWLVLPFSLIAFGVMGYHPGYEDDEIYLTAVKAALHPALYPRDGAFFRLQMQATVFDGWMARLVSLSHLPLAWVALFCQLAAIALILWSVASIADRLFAERRAQLGAVAMVSAMLTLPVAGTGLLLADQHLHPRNLATALILAAVASLLGPRKALAAPLLGLALLLHPIMGLFGVTFSAVLLLVQNDALPLSARSGVVPVILPLSWIFAAPDPVWREAVASRRYHFLSSWTWYEALGALAPLLLFWGLVRFARRSQDEPLARFAQAVLTYACFHQVLALLLLAPPALERLAPLQPMRYLHLVYLMMALLAGALLGRHLLRRSILRWAVFLLAINGGMYFAQNALFDGQTHFELPGSAPANAWTEAFAWIRQNTPQDAYFALDPEYLARPGETFHGFRALAERSRLADAIKDTSVVTQVPNLAPLWQEQQTALRNWHSFRRPDFERLQERFGVDWVLVENAQSDGLPCPWRNQSLSVCRIP